MQLRKRKRKRTGIRKIETIVISSSSSESEDEGKEKKEEKPSEKKRKETMKCIQNDLYDLFLTKSRTIKCLQKDFHLFKNYKIKKDYCNSSIHGFLLIEKKNSNKKKKEDNIKKIFKYSKKKKVYNLIYYYRVRELLPIFDKYFHHHSQEEGEKKKKKMKVEIVDWLTNTSCGSETNIFSSIEHRKFEKNNSINNNEQIEFFLINGKLSIPKDVILLIMKYFKYDINCLNEIKNILDSVGLINSSWYLITLESIGRHCDYFEINKNNVYKIPLIVMNNLKVIAVSCNEMLHKGMQHIINNVFSVVTLFLMEKEFISFLRSVSNQKTQLKYCKELQILGPPKVHSSKKKYESFYLNILQKENFPKLENLTLPIVCFKKKWLNYISESINVCIKNISIIDLTNDDNHLKHYWYRKGGGIKKFDLNMFYNLKYVSIEYYGNIFNWDCIKNLKRLTHLKLLKFENIIDIVGNSSDETYITILSKLESFEIEYANKKGGWNELPNEGKEFFKKIIKELITEKMKNLRSLRILYVLYNRTSTRYVNTECSLLKKNSYETLSLLNNLNDIKITIDEFVNNDYFPARGLENVPRWNYGGQYGNRLNITQVNLFLDQLNISLWNNVKTFELTVKSKGKYFFGKLRDNSTPFTNRVKKIEKRLKGMIIGDKQTVCFNLITQFLARKWTVDNNNKICSSKLETLKIED